jgi:MtN3 and saliva related transmembrane protein
MVKGKIMIDIAIIGLFAGLLTTGSQFPQVWKVYRTKSTGDLSGLWISILFFGTIVWLYYGLTISDMPLIIWNTISIFNLGYIALYKFSIIKTKTESPSYIKEKPVGRYL